MAGARERIFKSWAGISEVALIKEVATKGEHIQLCMEYWARKRKMAQAEYELFFHDVVQTYVERLLSERLVYKAENVLCNVQRDARCVYYQFACECADEELRELVLDYLCKKDVDGYSQSVPELQYHWELLQQLQACPELLVKCKAKLRRVNLETLLHSEAAFLKRLQVQLYFTNKNSTLLERLNKFTVWDYLVEIEDVAQLARWCCLSGTVADESYSELDLKYCEWTLEAEMYEHAVKSLKCPHEILRNCFAGAGYFFADERDRVSVVVRRICTSQSLQRNGELLEKLPIGRFLLQQGLHFLMLRNFVKIRELEEMAEEYADDDVLLKLMIALKENNLQERSSFEQVFYATKLYLEREGIDFESEQILVTFYAFLCSESSVATLNCFLLSSALQCVPYLKSLAHRLESSANSGVNTVGSCFTSLAANNLPTPYDFLRKFKNIDFRQLCKELTSGTLASFSNERMCTKYARKYKLNFLHYLKQQRSSFAVYYLLMDHLQQYGQLNKNQLFSACETVTELTLQYAINEELVIHCVAFIEMLGFDTQQLRNFLKLCHLLEGRVQETGDADLNAPTSYTKLLHRVEHVLLQRISLPPAAAEFPLTDYQALMRIVACNQQRQWPEQIMQHYAREDDWWRLLVLLQYFETPLVQLQHLAGHFETRAVGEHLLRAMLQDPATQSKRHASFSSRQQKKSRKSEPNAMTTSVETVNSSISSACNDVNNALFHTAPNQKQLHFLPDACGRLDLFAIILLSNSNLPEERISSSAKFLELVQDPNNYSTSSNLLKNSVKFQLPVLAVLASAVCSINVDWHWLVWLAVATDQWQEVVRLATLEVREVMWRLMENVVRQGDTSGLKRSFYIFFENSAFIHFCRFLQRTQHKHQFDEEDVEELRLYLLAWSNNAIQLPFCTNMRREELMLRSIKLLLTHLQCNFDSIVEQQKFTGCICRSDMTDISGLLDFCRLQAVFVILQHRQDLSQRFTINFEQLLQPGNQEYAQLLYALREAGEYNLAIQLATLLHLPIGEIVYAKWVSELDSVSANDLGFYEDSTLQRYEAEITQHALPPELLVNFFLHAAERLPKACIQKYQLLKRALNVIKQHQLFPNESFDRDQIEYEMIVCYLQLPDGVNNLQIYHSQYYEQIMLKERCVLYKSFLELKELAGIEDLNVSMKQPLTAHMQVRLEKLLNQLLEEGDIVEALRLQELFECRPIDLRFVVFCMALAEGVTTIFSMSSEERQLLREIEKSSFAKFNKRTLDSELRASGSHHGQSPTKSGSDLSDSCSTLEFEEIPSKEKRETLDTIQGIASKLKYGVDIGRRIVMAYRAAMYLDKEYLDVLRTKDPTVLLHNVTEEGCLHRLLVVSDILTSTHMTAQEIAELLAYEITTAVVRPRFYIFNADQPTKNTFKSADLWGYNIDRDFHLFLELTPNSTKLGNCLLEYCDALKAYRRYQDNKPYIHDSVFKRLAEIIRRYGLPANNVTTAGVTSSTSGEQLQSVPQVLSHKKQNLICVELLIKAHQCYVHECSMEGIANVLNRAKTLNGVLTQAKSWSLIVRMLSGIGRYREMFYCFDSLLKNAQFESLLSQFDEEKTIGLRQAILTYLREYCPTNSKEYLNLTAHHFLMYQELADMWEQDAQAVLNKVLGTAQVGSAQLAEQPSMANLTATRATKIFIPKLRSTNELITLLQQMMENYTHATENYLLANKLRLAQRSASMAEMVAMQIDLASKALEHNTTPRHCVCVINVQSCDDFRELINAELSVPQALILSRAYGYDINWSEALLSQYVILKNAQYLQDYLMHLSISDNIIDNIVKSFQLYAQHHRVQPGMEEQLAYLVTLVKSVTLRYQLASLLSLKPIVMSLINEQTAYYLRDTNYGRNEVGNIPDL